MNSLIGKYLIIAGAIIILAGILIILFHDKTGWLGRLPGDIHIERDNFSFYFPVTTLILLSIFISALIYMFRKYF